MPIPSGKGEPGTSDPSEDSGPSTGGDEAEALLAELLAAPDAAFAEGLRALLARRPEHAAALQRRLAALRAAGLLGQDARAGADADAGAAMATDGNGGPLPSCGPSATESPAKASLAGIVSDEDEGLPGRLGDFLLRRPLGGGGMGVVWLARQQSLQRDVALKLVRPEHLWFPQARARFRREVEAVARLQHPAIVAIHAVGEQDGVPYFAMEHVRGCSLDRVLAALAGKAPESLTGVDAARVVAAAANEGDGGSAPPEPRAPDPLRGSWVESALRIALAVARALAHAHGRGVLHRDVKPSNVLLAADGRVLLADFGLATAEGSSALTRPGTFLGSLGYAAPEQLDGAEVVDERTDVHALGATLWEMLTLRPPFAGANDEALRRAIRDGDLPPLGRHNRRVPQDVEVVCRTALARDPAQRYRTAAEFAADLERLLAHRPILARPPGLVLRSRRWVQRHPVRATVLAAVLLGSLAFALQQWRLRTAIAIEYEGAVQSRQVLIDLFDGADPFHTGGRAPTARELLDRARVRLQSTRGERPQVRAPLLEALAQVYWSLGEAGDAVPLVEEAVSLRRAHFGRGPGLGRALHLLARLRSQDGDAAAAERLYREALDVATAAGDGALVLAVQQNLALLWRECGRLDEAAELQQRVLEARRSNGGGDGGSALIVALVSAGELHLQRGDAAAAAPLLEEAERLSRTQHARAHPDQIAAAAALGRLRARQARFAEAEDALRTALEVVRVLFGDDAPHAAPVLDDLGMVRRARGDAPGAVSCFARALRVEAARGGEQRPIAATLQNHLGLAQLEAGDFAGGERTLRRAIELRAAAAPGSAPELARAQEQAALAAAVRLQHRLDEAASLYETAIATLRRHADAAALAGALFGQGALLADRGELDASRAIFVECLQLRRRCLPPSHPDLAHACHAVGRVDGALGRDEEAAAALAEAYERFAAALPATHPQVLAAAADLVDCLQRLRRFEAAAPVLEAWAEGTRAAGGEAGAQVAAARVRAFHAARGKPRDDASSSPGLPAPKAGQAVGR